MHVHCGVSKLKIAKHAADFSLNAGSIFFSLQFIF